MTESQKVLVVDDEPAIRRLLRASLTARGYAVCEASTGEEALQAVPVSRPDVILMDLCLPDVDGASITRALREWTQTPIIIVSVRAAESEKIAALDAGADDYVTKPFGPGELLARIRAALRRACRLAHDPVFRSGALTVDLERRVEEAAGERAQLTPAD